MRGEMEQVEIENLKECDGRWISWYVEQGTARGKVHVWRVLEVRGEVKHTEREYGGR